MTLILRRDIVSARYRHNDIIAFCEPESFAFLFQRSGNYTGQRKNRRDELSFVLSGLFFAIALKSCFRILHVISSSSAKDSRTTKKKEREREKGRERGREEGAFHVAYVIHRVCYLITAFAPRLAEPSSNDRAQ